MKALIERHLYQPAIVLPILMLVRLMTALDFSVTQILIVLVVRGSQYMFYRIAHRGRVENARREALPARRDGSCHC